MHNYAIKNPINKNNYETDEKINNLFHMLQSKNYLDRIDACNIIASTVNINDFPKLVELKYIEKILQLVDDTSTKVSISSIGCLRNICAEVGPLACKYIATSILLEKLLQIFHRCIEDNEKVLTTTTNTTVNTNCEEDGTNLLLLQVLPQLTNICDISNDMIIQFTRINNENNNIYINDIITLLSYLELHIKDINSIIDLNPIYTQLSVDGLYLLRIIIQDNLNIYNKIQKKSQLSKLLLLYNTIFSKISMLSLSNDITYKYLDIHLLKSLYKEMISQQGSIGNAFTVNTYPRIFYELKSLYSMIFLQILQYEIIQYDKNILKEYNIKDIDIQNIITIISSNIQDILSLDIEEILKTTLDSIQFIKSIIHSIDTKELSILELNSIINTTINKEQSIEEYINSINNKLQKYTKKELVIQPHSTYTNDTTLPLETLETESIQTHFNLFAQYASSIKIILDTLNILLLNIDDTNDKMDIDYVMQDNDCDDNNNDTTIPLKTNCTTQAKKNINTYLQKTILEIVNKYIDKIYIIGKYRLIYSSIQNNNININLKHFLTYTSLTEDVHIQLINTLQDKYIHHVSQILNQIRACSIIVLSSIVTCIPHDTIKEISICKDTDIYTTLYIYICSNIESSDYSSIFNQTYCCNSMKETTTDTNVLRLPYAQCIIEEVYAQISCIYHLLELRKLLDLKSTNTNIWDAVPYKLLNLLLLIIDTINITNDKFDLEAILQSIATIPQLLLSTTINDTKINEVSVCLLNLLHKAINRNVQEKELEILYEVINAIIDIYSDDIRYAQIYKNLNITNIIEKFIPIYKKSISIYSTICKKKLHLSLKRDQTYDVKNLLQKSKEALDNIKKFIIYKRKL